MYGQLRDIHGLDQIPWWPPGPGWWITGVLLLLLLLALFLLIRHLILYPPGSWRQEAGNALRQLRRSYRQRPPKETAGQLSELLRRIAIARFGRAEPASLVDDQWLEWLQRSDPNGFDWPTQGKLLTSLPYAPDDWQGDTDQLETLLKAAQALVSQSREDAARRPRWWRWRRRV